MTIVFNPYSIPVIAAALFVIALIIYVKKRTKTHAADLLLVLLFLSFLWSAVYALELCFTDLSSKIFAAAFEYISVSGLPVIFLIFVYRYVNPESRKFRTAALLLFIVPFTSVILMFTNSLHGLMYSGASAVGLPGTKFTFLTPQYGIGVTITLSHTYLVMLAAFIYIIYISVKTTKLISAQAIILSFCAAIPLFVNMLYYMKGFSGMNVDYTPVALLCSDILMAYLATETNRFYLKPLARDVVIENTADGIILIDNENVILDINATAQAIFSLNKKEVIGNSLLFLPGDLPSLISGNCCPELDIQGKQYCVSSLALNSDKDAYLGKVISVKDVTEAKLSQKRIHELAFTDALTGLPNSTYALQKLQYVLTEQQPSTVLLVGVNNLYHINTSYGYDMGDEIIKKAAQMIKPLIKADMLARMRGNEFIIIRNLSSDEDETSLAQNITRLFDSPLAVRDKFITAAVNIGICRFPADANDLSGIIYKVSLALGQARKTKEHIAFYSVKHDYDITRRNLLLNALITALDNGEFSLEYQPQYNIETRKLFGVEALLRWKHPQLGSIPPDTFIKLLEDSGLIIPVGNWVIEQAARQFKIWCEKGLDIPKFSINLSVRQFDYDGLAEYILHTLDRLRIPRLCLEIEVTETLAVLADSTVVEKINELSESGIRIAIDDFGAGFSSLTYFKYLNVDTLKVDKEISLDIHSNRYSQAIFESLKLVCDSLGIDIVAEYVETDNQIKKLESLGCKYYQGYYYSKPLSPHGIEDFIVRL